MTPLLSILDWWESINEFDRDYIAWDVCYRLIPGVSMRENSSAIFREFLVQKIDAPRHIARALSIEAVIDFYFFRSNLSMSLEEHLENVEGADKELKRLSNEAIPRVIKNKPLREKAEESWKNLKETQLNRPHLLHLERMAVFNRP